MRIKNVFNKYILLKIHSINFKSFLEYLRSLNIKVLVHKRYTNHLRNAFSYEDYEPRVWPIKVNGILQRNKITRRITSEIGESILKDYEIEHK